MKMKITFRNIFTLSILLIVLAFSGTDAFSQKAVLSLDTSSIRIGERESTTQAEHNTSKIFSSLLAGNC